MPRSAQVPQNVVPDRALSGVQTCARSGSRCGPRHHAGMGFWVPRPPLDRRETVGATIAANRTQGVRAVGGHIFVTNLNLRFMANRFDRLTGGEDLIIPRSEVTAVDVAERSLEGGPFSGGLRRRVHVVTHTGGELFVINRAEHVAELLRQWATRSAE